jgi:hypothetical protein
MYVSKSATRAAATSMNAGDAGLYSFVASAEGSLLAPEATTLALTEDLLGPGAVGFMAGGGLLLLGAADFAPPRAFFASRKGSQTLVTTRRFRAASWRSLSITADTTAAIFRP